MMMMTEDQLRTYLPMLCKRLDGFDLCTSLSGVLPDGDLELAEKKLHSPQQPNSMAVMFMYSTLKRRLGSDHVQVFLRAVQDQFELSSLGITTMSSTNERIPQSPPPPQPHFSHQALAPVQRHPHHLERTVAAPSMQQQPMPPPVLPHPFTPAPNQPGFRVPPHSDPPAFSGSKPSHDLPPPFTSSDGHSLLRSIDRSVDIQPLMNSKAQETHSVFPPMPSSHRPSAGPEKDRINRLSEQYPVSMREVVDNIAGKVTPAPSPYHGPQNQTRLPERPADRHAQNEWDRQFDTGLGSMRSEGPPSSDNAKAKCSAMNFCPQLASIPRNILLSVEDNSCVPVAEKSTPTIQSSSKVAGPPVFSGSLSTDDLPGPAPDKSGLQTDGDLTREDDVQPEQPDPQGNDDYGEETRQQSTLPLQNHLDRTVPGPLTTINIGEIVFKGEGYTVCLGGENSVITDLGKLMSRTGQEEELAVRPGAAAVHSSTASVENRMLNAVTHGPHQSPERQNLGQNAQSYGKHASAQIPMDVAQQALLSGQVSLYSSSQSAHHLTLPKAADQTVCKQLQPQTQQKTLGQCAEFSEQQSNRPTTCSHGDSYCQKTHLAERFQDQESSAELRNPENESDLSEYCFSNYTIYHDTKMKPGWENQGEEPDTMSYQAGMGNSMTKPDAGQLSDSRTCSLSSHLPAPSEAGSQQSTEYLADSLWKPGCLLGPNELLSYEARSIELPANLALTLQEVDKGGQTAK